MITFYLHVIWNKIVAFFSFFTVRLNCRMNAYTPASTTEGLELGITVEDFLGITLVMIVKQVSWRRLAFDYLVNRFQMKRTGITV